jgi:hypothetical protein
MDLNDIRKRLRKIREFSKEAKEKLRGYMGPDAIREQSDIDYLLSLVEAWLSVVEGAREWRNSPHGAKFFAVDPTSNNCAQRLICALDALDAGPCKLWCSGCGRTEAAPFDEGDECECCGGRFVSEKRKLFQPKEPCKRCGGSGEVTDENRLDHYPGDPAIKPCPDCGGGDGPA